MPYDEDVWSDALQTLGKANEQVNSLKVPKKPKTLSDKARLASAIKAQNKLNDVVVGSQPIAGTK